MAEFRYGPVELYLVGFEGPRPDPATLGALLDLLETGFVRLLDLVLVTKSEDGEVDVIEIETDTDLLGFGELDIIASGLAGNEDIDEFAEHIPPGGSAALVALELAFARTLAQNLAASGGVVLRSERITAPIVNAVLDLFEYEEEEGD